MFIWEAFGHLLGLQFFYWGCQSVDFGVLQILFLKTYNVVDYTMNASAAAP